jgi:hypothetical protein
MKKAKSKIQLKKLVSKQLPLLREKTNKAISWVVQHPRLAFDLLLICFIIVSGWLYNRKVAELDALQANMGKLALNLKEQVTIRDGQVEILKRIGGNTIVKKYYLPPEAPFIIQVSSSTGETNVISKTKGMTAKPGFGAEWGGKGIQPYMDLKWAYWGRYSGLVGGSLKGIGPGISRHLDDVLWGRPRNAELFLNYKVIRDPSYPSVVIGVRSNF